MLLKETDLNHLSRCAIYAAKEAGKYILKQYKHNHIVNSKEGGENYASQIVTEVDIKSQQIILHTLQDTIDKYNLGLLIEESKDDNSRFAKNYFWCIDPLDGTLPFIRKEHGFAVSIALVDKSGFPLIGVIYDPLEDKMYHSVNGLGCYCNNNQITQCNEFSTLRIYTDRNFLELSNSKEIVMRLSYLLNKEGVENIEVIAQAGAVINACKVLENNPSCYFKFPKEKSGGGSLWDYAASASIFNETNAVVSDIFGNSLELNRKSSCYMNHKGIIFASNKHIAKIIQQLYQDFK